jgi:hypothetical protein
VTKNAVPDESVVSNYYREAVRSWKLRSVLFSSEEDARAMEKRLGDGGDFVALAAEAVKAGKASGGEKADVVKPAGLLPQVREAVVQMKPGQISPVVAVGSGKKAGFTVVRFEEELFPDDPAEKEKARKRALEDRLKQEGRDYRSDLYKKVKINKKLVASVDYEANKGRIDKLLVDKRVLATIAGDKPVTVGELTAALKEHFYHGMDIAAEGKKLNKKKQEMLEQVIDKRLLRAGSARPGDRQIVRLPRGDQGERAFPALRHVPPEGRCAGPHRERGREAGLLPGPCIGVRLSGDDAHLVPRLHERGRG